MVYFEGKNGLNVISLPRPLAVFGEGKGQKGGVERKRKRKEGARKVMEKGWGREGEGKERKEGKNGLNVRKGREGPRAPPPPPRHKILRPLLCATERVKLDYL